jgi:hypothetical protein
MKRLLSIFFVIGLLLPCLSYAQDEPFVIAYAVYGEIYGLRDGQAPKLLVDTMVMGAVMSPDGQRLAYTSLAAYDANHSHARGRYEPSNLSVLNLADETVTPLWKRGETEPNILIFSRWKANPVKTLASWMSDRYGAPGQLRADLVWSPDSRYLAQLQTVMGEERSALTRLAIFDVTTGEMRIIARLGSILDGIGYAIFWLDEGLVIYSDYPDEDAADTITVMDSEGTILHTWEVERDLNFENPILYEGKQYLHFGWQHLYDVTTNKFINYRGTLATISAAAPQDSLIVEDCPESPFQYIWDIYSPQGDKLLRINQTAQPTFSPDGQQLVYITYSAENGNVTFFDGKSVSFYDTNTSTDFYAQNLIWGPRTYTITSIGDDECLRNPAG